MSQTKWQGLPKYRFRLSELAFTRLRHALLKETHVVVGDHPPERRVNHDVCDSGDGLEVAQCKGDACHAHNRCCWQ